MNIVKTKLRNRMAGLLLNAIIFIRNRLKVTDVKCYNYELPSDVIAAIGKNTKYSYKNQVEPATSSASVSASSTVRVCELWWWSYRRYNIWSWFLTFHFFNCSSEYLLTLLIELVLFHCFLNNKYVCLVNRVVKNKQIEKYFNLFN